jgi:hypothetical protein
MDKLIDTLFGPIDNKYCLYFYILSVFAFVFCILALLLALYYIFINQKKVEVYLPLIIASFVYALSYLQSRLLSNMCKKSI